MLDAICDSVYHGTAMCTLASKAVILEDSIHLVVRLRQESAFS